MTETLPRNNPDKIEPYLSVTMDQTMAHACNIVPWNFRMRGLHKRGDLPGSLAENLQ
jgi:hypothetical protein